MPGASGTQIPRGLAVKLSPFESTRKSPSLHGRRSAWKWRRSLCLGRPALPARGVRSRSTEDVGGSARRHRHVTSESSNGKGAATLRSLHRLPQPLRSASRDDGPRAGAYMRSMGPSKAGRRPKETGRGVGVSGSTHFRVRASGGGAGVLCTNWTGDHTSLRQVPPEGGVHTLRRLLLMIHAPQRSWPWNEHEQ